ncbi:hypothetical protein CEQ90_00775 [Lewinellaceae bacterium SD302]|nr:hypothetical protein CEQ90_00775 [Lewinellaceae bacterium SD302]
MVLAAVLPQLAAQQVVPQCSEYQLEIIPDLSDRSIEAIATLLINTRSEDQPISLSLSNEFRVSKVTINNSPVSFRQSFNSVSIPFPVGQKGEFIRLSIYYSGTPTPSTNPPWTGGFHQSLDYKDRSWLNTAPINDLEQSWLPVIPGMVADSSTVDITVRDRLSALSNGQLIKSDHDKDRRKITYTYRYAAPIRPEKLQLHVGYYATYDTTFTTIEGQVVSLQHHVLDYNLNRASKHLNQFGKILTAWEHYLGPLPDTLRHLQTVEVPFGGTAVPGLIQYGNRFMRGSYGGFIPLGMDWDHELVRSVAALYIDHRFGQLKSNDRWLREAFITYLESLYVEFYYSKEKALEYLDLYRPYVRERQPLVDSLASDFDLNDGEFQAKGALLLHSIRQAINNDGEWLLLIRDFLQLPKSTNETQAFIRQLKSVADLGWTPILKQYLHHHRLPVLEYWLVASVEGDFLYYRYTAKEVNYQLPITIEINDERSMIVPTSNTQSIRLTGKIRNRNSLDLNVMNALVILKPLTP